MTQGKQPSVVSCPHCETVQPLPAARVLLNCKSCGKRFSSTEAITRAAAPQAEPGQETRKVRCHKCGQTHGISRFTRTTNCPGCTAEIVIGDLSLTSYAGQSMDLRGRLWIGLKGSLAGHKAICTDAVVEGALDGELVCENTIEFRSKTEIKHRLCAKHVHVGRDASIKFSADCEIENIEVEGVIDDDVTVTGRVTILPTGQLLGNVTAASVRVEPGGIWTGKGKIGGIKKD